MTWDFSGLAWVTAILAILALAGVGLGAIVWWLL